MKFKEAHDLVKDDLDRVIDGFHEIIEERSDFSEMQKMLEQILVGGKVLRPTLVFLTGGMLGGDKELLTKQAISCETMHIATLVHDDAIDSADLRRGRPTINSVYGVDLAVLLGDYLFATAGKYSAMNDNIRTLKLFTETLAIIAKGEIKQAFSSYVINQTYDEYIQRMAGKTSALFQLSTKSAAILSNASEDQINNIDKFAYYLGLAFQIVDDILDYTGSESDVGKPVGADLRQGTLTLPASMLMERYPDDNPVIEIFNHRDVEENIKKAVQMVRDSDIIEKCYAEAERFVNKALEYLYKLPDNKYRDGLEALSRYVIERRK